VSVALAPLPPMDVAGRADRLRARFEQAGIDALVVTRLPNVVYLTGFTGSSAMVLVGPDELVFVTDGRYGEQAAEQLAAAGVEARLEVRIAAAQRDVMSEAAGGSRRLGLEAHGVTWAQQRLSPASGSRTPSWSPPSTSWKTARVKEPAEVARIQAACTIADEALGSSLLRLGDRPSERKSRSGSSSRCETGVPPAPASIRSSRPGPSGAKPHAATVESRDRDGRAGRDRFRVHRRRVLLRHGAHAQRRRPGTGGPARL
jgi:hypothetical protein